LESLARPVLAGAGLGRIYLTIEKRRRREAEQVGEPYGKRPSRSCGRRTACFRQLRTAGLRPSLSFVPRKLSVPAAWPFAVAVPV